MSEIRYAKITLVDGTRFILRVTGESERLLRGIEVNTEGDEVAPQGFHQRLRIIEKALVKKIVPLRMNPTYATLEPAPKKTAAQLDAEIAEALDGDGEAHATRRIPADVKAAIESRVTEFIESSYRRHATVGGREPCLTVGLLTDYLRQAYMPEDFRYATKDRQRTWTRSVLESLRRAGRIGSSFGARARCYEPVRSA